MYILMFACIVLFLWTWFARKRNKDEPPSLPGALPLIGHAHLLLRNSTQFWDLVKKLSYECQQSNGIISLYIGPMTVYVYIQFKSFAVETLGPWSVSAKQFLKDITPCLIVSTGDRRAGSFFDQRIGIAIQRGNAASILATISRGHDLYILTDPDDFSTVANACLQKNVSYEVPKTWIGEGLIVAKTSIWQVHRKLLNPAFNQKILDGFLDVFNKRSREFVKNLEIEIDQKSFDPYNSIRHHALETICQTTFGIDFNDSQFIMAVDKICHIFAERVQKLWLHGFMLSWSSMKKNQDACLKILHTMTKTMLQKAKVDYLNTKLEKSEGPKFKALLDYLIELEAEKGVLNEREIREEVDGTILAGFETSATALMYCILMISSYPKVQEKVFEELYEVFGDDDRDVTKQDLSRLCYLDAVLKETIRIYPVIPGIARHLDKDVKLSNCTLSKGATCFMLIYGVHRNPLWGPDPEKFYPERWLDPTSLPKLPTAFTGFSAGRRNCIGKAYAFMSLKTTLVHVFRNYEVRGDHTKMQLKFDVVLKPVSGHHISIQRRNTKSLISNC